MALSPGARLGPYEIQSALGAGGMGEVYRARDTRLERTVAIKVLTGSLAATPEQQARFEREARAIAALQHPHICVLHDLGRDQGMPYLVMEYLEGETLAARLRRGPLPLAELVKVGAEIAAALEQAHRAGIVHRDLKPGNVMLAKAGAKLLDFGLAKPSSPAASGVAPSFTASLAVTALESPMTQAGTVLGTVQYMSPEQIEGREADARSDIFALGCVLYEMATGKPAFAGNTNLSVAAAILEKEPAPLRALQPLTPPALEHVIEACLRKAPEARWQSAADVKSELAWIGADDTDDATAAGSPAPRANRRWTIGVAAAAAVIAALATFFATRAPAPEKLIAELPPPPGTHFVFNGEMPSAPAISPDGRTLAFVARDASGRDFLWLRRLDQFQARELPGTEGAFWPFWSPDGGSIGFFSADALGDPSRLMALNLTSGQPRLFADVGSSASGSVRGASWAPDGTILFAPGVVGPIYRISVNGGTPVAETTLDHTRFTSDRFPYFLPDGRHFLYLAVQPTNDDEDMLYFASLDGRVNRPLVHSLTGAIYASGYLLYSTSGTLMAQRLDSSSGELRGEAHPVAPGVDDDFHTWRPAYSAARDGTVVYAAGGSGPEQLAWVDRSGHVGAVLSVLPAISGEALTAAIAPDGQRLAVSIDTGTQDIWVRDLGTGGASRLTFGPLSNLGPVWSPDGAWIAYNDVANGHLRIFRRRADGSGGALPLPPPHAADADEMAGAWSPVTPEMLAVVETPGGDALCALPLDGDAPVRTLIPAAPATISIPRLSPDGRWASYLIGTNGQPTSLYVVPFRGGPGQWQVTSLRVATYDWASSGKEIVVVDSDGRLLSIAVGGNAAAPAFAAPRLLAEHFPPTLAATPDAQHFLAYFYPDDQQRMEIVRDWQAGLR